MMCWTDEGVSIPAITADQMREIDRIAMEDFSLGILQMMENAGRNLAGNAMEMLGRTTGTVAIVAGAGGNGGGGLACARHLHNRGYTVAILLDRDPGALGQAAAAQLAILDAAGLLPVAPHLAGDLIQRADLVVDALIGYGLHGAPRGRTADMIEKCNRLALRVLSLDVPSGLNATTGQAPGVAVRPERTLTLALPKTGLNGLPGEVYLADIGIPPEVYARLGIHVTSFFGRANWLRLHSRSTQ